MNVLLIALGASPPGEGILAGIEALHRGGAQVRLVSRQPPPPTVAAALDDVLPLPSSRRPTSHLPTSHLPTSHRQFRLGRLRFDPDRLPAALRLLHGTATRPLIEAADVLVAVDPAAVPAVWLAARHNRGAAALNGVPAAVSRHGGPT